ncbi:MAG TPA: 3D-(3,5/4)-trihydroxycyclohexane-1,2-dione acylhydrolase (decyclizing) [Solirubrobacteraceae bacterium]|nr:3D-(3,5/4)-trihydroxycyclohexane-1,2-dione acylhydrolase (decyclizing) [Solirubrobacteraceae bacterium]
MPRLTTAQALVRFLAAQHVERDGRRERFFAGCLGILGHGNIAGLGEALRAHADLLPFRPARNEQGMVHVAVGYARQRNRMATFACTSSVGPGATNMVTGAALATINRLPVLLLPGDVFATRRPHPVLQGLELPHDGGASVNDCLRPVSRYFARIERPEQLPSAALEAMRVLCDPAQTGAVTLALPEDVQAEAFEVPAGFLDQRTWPVERRPAAPAALERAAEAIRGARRPLLVAGGGVIYSEATGALRRFADETGIPVAETHAGRGALTSEHPLSLGALGATGGLAANRLAARADLIIGVGTRWGDFTTASRSAFLDPGARFININVAEHDAAKLSAMMVTADARVALEALRERLEGYRAPADWEHGAVEAAAAWRDEVDRQIEQGERGDPPAQAAVIGAVNDACGERGVVVCAAGSAPGELHRLWKARDPQGKGYHVEYGYSCMGYEIPGAIGAKLAAPDRPVIALVGDGSYLMLPGELATAVAERVPIVVVIVDNGGYASIGALSRQLGERGWGTLHHRDHGRLPEDEPGADGGLRPGGEPLPLDLAENARSLGARVVSVRTIAELRAALADALAAGEPSAVYIRADRYRSLPSYESWWEVPVAEVSEQAEVRMARERYEAERARQRAYLTPSA